MELRPSVNNPAKKEIVFLGRRDFCRWEKEIDDEKKRKTIDIMSHYRLLWLGIACLFFLGLDFPKFKTGEERALKNFQIAISHYNAREYSLAREKLISVLTDKKDFPLARLYLARSLYQSGDWLDSLQELEEIQKQNSSDSLLSNRIEILTMEIGRNDVSTKETIYFQSIKGEENRGFRFRNPVDTVVDEVGNLYVLSFGTANLIAYNPNFEPIWLTQGGFARKMKGPVSMNYYHGNFLVADFPSDYLYIFNKKGSFLDRVGGTGSALNQFRGPSGIARDDQGNLYVSDSGNHRILKWNKDYRPLFSFGTSGKGKLETPTGILWKNNKIYVLEKIRPRIIIYDEEGNYLSEIGSNLFKKPRSISFFNDTLVIADEMSGLLFYKEKEESWTKLPPFKDKSGRLRNIDRPFAATKDLYGYIYSSDYNRNRVDIFAPKNYLLSNLNLEIEKVDTSSFPNINLYIYLKNRKGQDILGLNRRDFDLTESLNSKKLFDLTDLKQFNDRSTISLVYENSETVVQNHQQFNKILDPVFAQLTSNDRIELLRSGKNSTKIIPYTVSKNDIYRAIRTSNSGTVIKSGKSIYHALGNLTKELGPRAVVYLGSGKYPVQSKQVHLQKLIQYAKSNGIQVYPVLYEKPQVDDDSWDLLAEETGGKIILLNSNEEEDLYKIIQSKKDNRYILSYSTETKSTIHGRWVPITLEAKYRNFGSKTQGGYFVP